MFGGIFGQFEFGWSGFASLIIPKKRIAVVGDQSSHGGIITTSNQDERLNVGGEVVAVEGAIHSCPTHGDTTITAITTKSFCNGKLVLTTGAVAGCGAVINPPDRKVYIE